MPEPSEHAKILLSRFDLAVRMDVRENNDESGTRLDAARQAVYDYVARLESGLMHWLRRRLFRR